MRIFVFNILLLSLLSCDHGNESHKSNHDSKHMGIEVSIKSGAGSAFENSKYLASPLNHAFVVNQLNDTLDFLILGRRIDAKKVFVHPLAYFELLENGNVREFILALPDEDIYLTTDRLSFQDLVVKHSSIKLIIDTWFSSYKGLGKLKVVNWRDEIAASTVTNNFLEFHQK